MKKLIIAAVAVLAMAPAAFAAGVRVNDPTGFFSDAEGNQGYVEVTEDGVQACNENPDSPAGDELTGYAYVSRSGQPNPTAGTQHVGAADADGDDDQDPAGPNPNDCPAPASDTTQLPPE